MATLQLAFFGPFEAKDGGQLVDGLTSPKIQALLAYLALEQNRPHRRSALAALLWPEKRQRLARQNMRQSLQRLHHIPNLMIAAAGLELLMVFIHRHQISGVATSFWTSFWLYCGHLILFGLIDLILHGLQYGYSASGSRLPGEAALES